MLLLKMVPILTWSENKYVRFTVKQILNNEETVVSGTVGFTTGLLIWNSKLKPSANDKATSFLFFFKQRFKVSFLQSGF